MELVKELLNIILKIGGSTDKIMHKFMLYWFILVDILTPYNSDDLHYSSFGNKVELKDHPETLVNENEVFGKALLTRFMQVLQRLELQL